MIDRSTFVSYGRTPLDRCQDLLTANRKKLQNGYWSKLCLLAVASVDQFLGKTLRNGRVWEPSMFMFKWDVLHTTHLDAINNAARTEPPSWASMLLSMIVLPRVEGAVRHPYYPPVAPQGGGGGGGGGELGALSSQMLKPMHDLATIVLEKMLDASLSNAFGVETAAATVDELVKVQLAGAVRVIHGVAYCGNIGLLKKLFSAEAVRATFEKQVQDEAFRAAQPPDIGPCKLSKWMPTIDGKLYDDAKRGILHYACIGHTASATGNAEVVMTLLDWKVDLYANDGYDLAPLELVRQRRHCFRPVLSSYRSAMPPHTRRVTPLYYSPCLSDSACNPL